MKIICDVSALYSFSDLVDEEEIKSYFWNIAIKKQGKN